MPVSVFAGITACMLNLVYYQHYDEIINQFIQFRGEVVKGGGGGRDVFKIQGGVGLKGEVKKFRGVWTLDEAMP